MREKVLLLSVSALLAGCAAPAADETGLASTSAPDLAGPAGSVGNATAPDLGALPHLHDYWLGRDRVTLYDDVVEGSAEEHLGWTALAVFARKEAHVGGVVFRFPDGATVYEGTGLLELTATWDDPRVTSLAVRYRAGEGGDLSEPVPLPNGAKSAIEVAPEMTDMPHMTVSRWRLAFAPSDPGAALGSFRLKAEIVRMRDVSEFPGHPDLFEGRPDKVLHDSDGRSAQSSYAKRVPNLVLEGEFGEHEIAPARVVPMETLAILAEVDVLKAEASVGQVSEIRFFFHGADSTSLRRVQPVEGSMAGKRYVFAVPVEMENTDSPYAPSSQWRFLVEAATTATGSGSERTCGGCVDTDVEFHLKLTAYDHVLDRMSRIEGN